MQAKDAAKLRKEWGDKPCSHPSICRLYDLGSHDGYVCCQCGETHFDKNDFKLTAKKEES